LAAYLSRLDGGVWSSPLYRNAILPLGEDSLLGVGSVRRYRDRQARGQQGRNDRTHEC